MRELVEGYDEHLEGPEDPADVGHVPEDGDDDDVGDDDAEGGFLGGIYAEGGALEQVGVRVWGVESVGVAREAEVGGRHVRRGLWWCAGGGRVEVEEEE